MSPIVSRTMRKAFIVHMFVAIAIMVPGAECQVIRNLFATLQFYGATTFLNLTDKADLTKLLKDPKENLTVFAPTNDAFNKLPPSVLNTLETDLTLLQQVMNFHLAAGLVNMNVDNAMVQTRSDVLARVNVYGSVHTLSGSKVLLADNQAQNGVANIMGAVMYPLPTRTALNYVNGDSFSTLLLALTKAGATSMLLGNDITVLAPTDTAFQRLPPGVLSNLLQDIPKLTRVLKNHLVSRVWYTAGLSNGQSLQTQSGESLTVTITGDTIQIGAATITTADVSMTNGAVHVIDTVLLPA